MRLAMVWTLLVMGCVSVVELACGRSATNRATLASFYPCSAQIIKNNPQLAAAAKIALTLPNLGYPLLAKYFYPSILIY